MSNNPRSSTGHRTSAPGPAPSGAAPEDDQDPSAGEQENPYDLRHSALPTWLRAGADPVAVVQRAGNSVEIPLNRYAKCL
ncbi:hypothetical protein ACWD26_40295 [Streptomyces sp. NPDC002787]